MEETDKFEKKEEYKRINNRYNRRWLWQINKRFKNWKRTQNRKNKEIEIKLDKIKLLKIIADTIKKAVISEKSWHHISRHRRHCA